MSPVNMNRESLKIFKQNDYEWILGFEELIHDTGYEVGSFIFATDFNSSQTVNDVNKTLLRETPAISRLIEIKSQVLNTIDITFRNNLRIKINRHHEPEFDFLNVWFSNVPIEMIEGELLFAKIKKIFKVLSIDKDFTFLMDDRLERIYKAKEVETETLRTTFLEMTEKLNRDLKTIRKEQFDELKKNKTQLEEDYKQLKAQLQKDYEDKLNQLHTERIALEEKKKEFETRESKYVRRDIHKKMKETILSRKVKPTEEIEALRKPNTYLSLGLIFLFGSLFTTASISSMFVKTQDYSIWVSKAIFGLLFGGTVIYFYRWHGQWFNKHAEEEARLKKFDLDIDRASWIVEMMIEYEIERDRQIPEYLVKGLSKGLFIDDKVTESVEHPFEQFASTILGSSAEATINTPAGTLKIDRKGIKKIEKNMNE